MTETRSTYTTPRRTTRVIRGSGWLHWQDRAGMPRATNAFFRDAPEPDKALLRYPAAAERKQAA